MQTRKKIVLALTLAFGSQLASAAAIDLTSLGYVQYGDAQSYSLPIANYQFGEQTNNGTYTIQSSAGQISSLTVLGTGSSGQPVVTNFDGMDNAYATPSGIGGDTFWYPNEFTYQGTQGTVNFNGDNTWDVSLAALQTFLAGEDMVIFFNNNQLNAGETSLQSLAAWAKVWVTDATGAQIDDTFYFTNMGGSYNLVSLGGGGNFMGDVTAYTGAGTEPVHVDETMTDFVLSGGHICVAHNGDSSVTPIPVDCALTDAQAALLFGAGWTVSAPINHNLGADTAAYAILFPELNALLASLFGSGGDLSGYTLHADIRLGCELLTVQDPDPQGNDSPYGTTPTPYGNSFECGTYNGWGTELNNGYEQIFIATAIVPDQGVPEPGVLALLGIGLLGMFGLRRKHSA